jgi:hypothetical protein
LFGAEKSSEIQEITAIKHRETFQRNYLDFMLDEGLLARTIPEKPRSRLQRYQTTVQGKALLETDKQGRGSFTCKTSGQ